MHPTVIFFELGYIFNIVGILILILQIRQKRHIEGISFYTQILNTIGVYVKIFYFPNTVLVDYWFCWVEFLASMGLTAYLMYLMTVHKRISFNKEQNFWDYRILSVVSLILAVISNYEKKQTFEWSQLAIRYAIIVEAAALLPQLRLMKLEKFVTRNFGYYLVAISLSRLARVFFWVYQFADNYGSDTYYTLIAADLLYILLTADFIYNFIKHRNSTLIPYS